jgi:branched-chain amino acid transport system ATP-binding protein
MLVGPNGAGKTTFINARTRLAPLAAGTIALDGVDIATLSAERIVACGISRSFQKAELFSGMTVLENVLVGLYSRTRTGLDGALALPAARREERAARATALRVLEDVGLASAAHRIAGTLPYGDQKLLDVARALVSEPKLLLLDEPFAGVTQGEVPALLRCIERAGRVSFDGRELGGADSATVVAAGIIHCPEGRHVFPELTVDENLRMGAYAQPDLGELSRVRALFPVLADRRGQAAGTLSGGEQQMLAIARALMARPKLLLIDEPSLGLAPVIVEQIFEILGTLRGGGVSIVLVEQNAALALEFADRAYVLAHGRLCYAGPAAGADTLAAVQRAYLG